MSHRAETKEIIYMIRFLKYSLTWPNSILLGVPVIIGMFVGILSLNALLIEKPKFDELALGNETSISLGHVDGVQVHCHDLADLEKCSNGYLGSDMKDVILWLGNSQLHAINQMKPNDETATPILHRLLRDHGYYFMTLSQPNANLQEHYLLYEYLLDRLSIKFLVLPVVFDDMREMGIRPTLEPAFSDKQLLEKLSNTDVGKKLLANFGEQDSAGNDMAALEDTLQESTERFLNESLAAHSTIWAERSSMRGQIFNFLYQLRNWVFDINPSSIRKIIPGRYLSNIDAFKAILDTAREQNIKVLVYIVPLRNDVTVPYQADQYQNFKKEIQSLSDRDEVRFVNLENLVPGKLWGTKDSTSIGGGKELDFMHFKARGHSMLAEGLKAELLEMLNKGK